MFGQTPGSPRVITSRGLEGAWDTAIRTIWTSGQRLTDQRGNKIREILNMNLHITGHFNDYPQECPCGIRYGQDFAIGLLNTECAMAKAKEFDYSYGERIRRSGALDNVISILKVEPESRTCVLPVFNSADTDAALERATKQYPSVTEVPCVVAAEVIVRDNQLHMFLIMRSNDVLTAMPSDVYGFRELQQYIANQVGVKMGSFSLNVMSAHIIEENGYDFMMKYMEK